MRSGHDAIHARQAETVEAAVCRSLMNPTLLQRTMQFQHSLIQESVLTAEQGNSMVAQTSTFTTKGGLVENKTPHAWRSRFE